MSGALGFDADVTACAGLVERGDPDRFAAVMAAPAPQRPGLFVLYAFNLEVARAPWATQEPLIAEMRVQWWADVLAEIASGAGVRRHEVATPLSRLLDAEGARLLMPVVEARRRDAAREPMADVATLRAYLAETGGALLWAAARALGSAQEARARAAGTRSALANYLLAVPEFLARGVNPLPAMTEAEFAALLRGHLEGVSGQTDRPLRIAELACWRAPGILRRALRDPAAVPEGRLGGPEVLRRLTLLRRGLLL